MRKPKPTASANKRKEIMQRQASNLKTLSQGVTLFLAALLLASVAGCQGNPCVAVVQHRAYKPPAELMTPAPTQYLLPPVLQTKE